MHGEQEQAGCGKTRRFWFYFTVRKDIGSAGKCPANKVKLTPPTKLLSKQGSRRRSGLIVDVVLLWPVTGYQELAGAFLVTAA
jgi:hypothetical protein